MPYENFDYGAKLAAMGPWHRVDQVNAVMMSLGSVNFSVVSSRESARAEVTAMIRADPVSETMRFDDSSLYIDLGNRSWATLFTQLIESLGYREVDRGERTRSPQESGYNDAFHSFWKARDAILAKLRDPNSITTRAEFEVKNNLIWRDDDDDQFRRSSRNQTYSNDNTQRRIDRVENQLSQLMNVMSDLSALVKDLKDRDRRYSVSTTGQSTTTSASAQPTYASGQASSQEESLFKRETKEQKQRQ